MSTPAEPATSAASAHREAIERLRALLALPATPRADEWASRWRAEHDLIAALPPRFGQVLEALLARLESAAMFGEESCSFSAADLRGELQVWLAKAERALE